MSPTTRLTDLTDDALLLIIEKLILDKVGLESLRRCCKHFRSFFSVYHTEVRAMRERAVEKAWMEPNPTKASSVRVASNLSEKEEVMMRGEEAHSGGVIFLAACDRFIVIVRYNEQDMIVCACPNLDCSCETKRKSQEDVAIANSLQLFARKRLEVWTLQMQLLLVVSSEQFGRSFCSSGQGPTGNWPRYQFWSGARVRSPMFAYDPKTSIFVWVESQAREIEINFLDVERKTSECVKIKSDERNSYSECLPRAVSMHSGLLSISYERDGQNLLYLRWYKYTKQTSSDSISCIQNLESEVEISELEPNLLQYSNFILDQNSRFTVAAFSTWVRGVPRAIATHITTVRTEDVMHALLAEIHNELLTSKRLTPVQAYINGVKISEREDLVAVMDSNTSGEPLVRLLHAANLDEVATVHLPEATIPPTTEPYRGGVLWCQKILLVVTDELIHNLEEHAGRTVTRFALKKGGGDREAGGDMSWTKRQLDFWQAVHAAQTSRDPQSMGSWRQEKENLHLEAISVVEKGLVLAVRDRRGDSTIAFIDMLTSKS